MKFGRYNPQTNVTLNCEGIVDTLNNDVIGHCDNTPFLGSLQVWDFSKLLLKDSTGPPQIWPAKSQDLHDAKLRSF